MEAHQIEGEHTNFILKKEHSSWSLLQTPTVKSILESLITGFPNYVCGGRILNHQMAVYQSYALLSTPEQPASTTKLWMQSPTQYALVRLDQTLGSHRATVVTKFQTPFFSKDCFLLPGPTICFLSPCLPTSKPVPSLFIVFPKSVETETLLPPRAVEKAVSEKSPTANGFQPKWTMQKLDGNSISMEMENVIRQKLSNCESVAVTDCQLISLSPLPTDPFTSFGIFNVKYKFKNFSNFPSGCEDEMIGGLNLAFLIVDGPKKKIVLFLEFDLFSSEENFFKIVKSNKQTFCFLKSFFEQFSTKNLKFFEFLSAKTKTKNPKIGLKILTQTEKLFLENENEFLILEVKCDDNEKGQEVRILANPKFLWRPQKVVLCQSPLKPNSLFLVAQCDSHVCVFDCSPEVNAVVADFEVPSPMLFSISPAPPSFNHLRPCPVWGSIDTPAPPAAASGTIIQKTKSIFVDPKNGKFVLGEYDASQRQSAASGTKGSMERNLKLASVIKGLEGRVEAGKQRLRERGGLATDKQSFINEQCSLLLSLGGSVEKKFDPPTRPQKHLIPLFSDEGGGASGGGGTSPFPLLARSAVPTTAKIKNGEFPHSFEIQKMSKFDLALLPKNFKGWYQKEYWPIKNEKRFLESARIEPSTKGKRKSCETICTKMKCDGEKDVLEKLGHALSLPPSNHQPSHSHSHSLLSFSTSDKAFSVHLAWRSKQPSIQRWGQEFEPRERRESFLVLRKGKIVGERKEVARGRDGPWFEWPGVRSVSLLLVSLTHPSSIASFLSFLEFQFGCSESKIWPNVFLPSSQPSTHNRLAMKISKFSTTPISNGHSELPKFSVCGIFEIFFEECGSEHFLSFFENLCGKMPPGLCFMPNYLSPAHVWSLSHLFNSFSREVNQKGVRALLTFVRKAQAVRKQLKTGGLSEEVKTNLRTALLSSYKEAREMFLLCQIETDLAFSDAIRLFS